jgi:hypothetical protein
MRNNARKQPEFEEWLDSLPPPEQTPRELAEEEIWLQRMIERKPEASLTEAAMDIRRRARK